MVGNSTTLLCDPSSSITASSCVSLAPPPQFWAEALSTATFLVNRRPCRATGERTPHELLLGVAPDYTKLRVFGSLCYPNLTATTPNKLSPCSVPCVFLDYPTDHRGYRCYEPTTRRVFTSRHVVFDEMTFPFRQASPPGITTAGAPEQLPLDDQPCTPPAVAVQAPPPMPPAASSVMPPSGSQTTTSRTAPARDATPPAPVTTLASPVHTDAQPASPLSSSSPAPTMPSPPATTPPASTTRYVLTSSTPISPVLTSVRNVLKDPNWRAAMQLEFDALQANRTWRLVSRPPGVRVITGKWVFKIKTHSDGSLDRYKARCFASNQPASSTPSTRMRSASCHAPSTGYAKPHERGSRALSPSSLPLALGTRSDSSLFVYHNGRQMAYLLLYVDDMVLTASTTMLLEQLIQRLRTAFAMKDIGPVKYFLGIDVKRNSGGFFLSQSQYAADLLECAGMSNCKPVDTPADTKQKVSTDDGNLLPDGSSYHSLAGALQYLTITRPDIAYTVQQVCLHMHAPRDCHLALLKRVLRYVKGTSAFGMQLLASSTPTITAYTDADWAGCPDTRRSMSGYCVFFGDALVSRSSKRQPMVSRSSTEAEYRGIANAVAECSWLRHLLGELYIDVPKATIAYC
ncbi:uncharacterized protein LOC120686567 [Panicum virgatum]|uniref:uncharacterized protein LOC120686567 n=1 Tax=Panicum virgatum TaxID=38727 RepID=UPI0019D60577|nr:uncharacterized protein LOC120686567 [Panicum virgatum]